MYVIVILMYKFACQVLAYFYHMTWHNLTMVSELVIEEEFSEKIEENFQCPTIPTT